MKTRRFQKFVLLALAGLLTVVALFYLEEDWRGKRAWDRCKAELEAKGTVLDWNKFIPPGVPDDQNFFMTDTNILVWFKKPQTKQEMEAAENCPWQKMWQRHTWSDLPALSTSQTNPLTVAILTVLTPDEATAHHHPGGQVIILGESQTATQTVAALKQALGRSALGAAGLKFSELQLSNLTPARIWLGSDSTPSTTDLSDLIPENLDKNLGRLQIVATDDRHRFDVRLIDAHVTAAGDYLNWSDDLVPTFDEIRQALKRPYAILPGDYSEPYLIPIPHFVNIRGLAQTLGQRAQCDLLLHNPDAALHELTLIHDVCRILQKPPAGKPETLVEAMINVAVAGLYVNIIEDGFRYGEWHKRHLIALQEQLNAIDLPRWVATAFRCEAAADVQTFGTTPSHQIYGIISGAGPAANPPGLWSRLKDPLYLFLEFAPRGWMYQNLVTLANLPKPYDVFDLEHNVVHPPLFDQLERTTRRQLSHKSPFMTLATIAIPNYAKSIQVTTYNQNLVNEAEIACALERYRLTDGEYPTALDALVPSFIDKLPHDIIDGQPLHYRRTEDGKFQLYSVGWNERDDGGKVGQDLIRGDWVWPN